MTRSTLSGVLGWTFLVLAAGVAIWSVNAFVVHPPQINRLDLIDLLLGAVAAVTLLVAGLRLLTGKSVWQPLLLGFVASFGLSVLALLTAAKDFNR